MNRNVFSCLICLLCLSVNAQNSGSGTKSGSVQPSRTTYTRKPTTAELQNVNDVYYYNGKPYTGISIDLFEDKTRMQEISWRNGLLHGVKSEYFPGGKLLRAQISFTDGRRNGYFVYYHDNGKIKLSGKYTDDLLDSTVNAFYDNGNPKYTHHYVAGVREGESLTYYKNGNPEQRVILKNEKPDGQMLSYYEAGNLRQEAWYSMGVRNGKFLRYHLTGLLAEESYYKNGFQDSVSRSWDNVFGTMLKEEYYKSGQKEGVWTTYNEAGDTLTMFTWKADKLNGPFKKYYSGVVNEGDPMNGKEEQYDPKKSSRRYIRVLDEYGSYADGQLDGEFKSGLYNREAHVEGWYSNGVMVGEWKYWNADDKLVLHEKYDADGNLIYQKPKLKKLKGDR